MKPMEALCSGSAWAALTHSLLGSETDLEGFILGEVVQKVEISAQDEGMDKHEALSVLHIKGFRASIPNRFSFYDKSLELVESKLEEILGDDILNVVGWFSFRRNTSLRISYREEMIHRALEKRMSCHANEFITAVLTASLKGKERSNTLLESAIFRSVSPCNFESIAMKIANLDKSSHSGYSKFSTGVSRSGINLEMVAPAAEQSERARDSMIQTYRGMLAHMQELSNVIETEEADISALEGEIWALRKKLREPRPQSEPKASVETDKFTEEVDEEPLVDVDTPPQTPGPSETLTNPFAEPIYEQEVEKRARVLAAAAAAIGQPERTEEGIEARPKARSTNPFNIEEEL